MMTTTGLDSITGFEVSRQGVYNDPTLNYQWAAVKSRRSYTFKNRLTDYAVWNGSKQQKKDKPFFL